MAQIAGVNGGISVAAGTQLKHLLNDSGGGIGPYQFTINTTSPEFDNTEFASSLVTSSRAGGIPDWSVSVSGRFPHEAGQTGYEGLVTWGSGYALHVRAWTLTMNFATLETTAMASTAPTWKAWIPGLMTWNGTFDAGLDSSTAPTLPAAAAAGTSATFKLTEETTNDNTLAGAILPTAVSPSVVVNSSDPSRVQYTYAGDGALTVAGDSPILPTGTVALPDTTEIVCTAASGRTYTGDAFLSSLSINVPINGLIDVTATLQGTGALTPA